MDAGEFVVFAGRIAVMGKAGARSAVSRAYYGTFHLAQELLTEMVSEPHGSGKSHALVPQFLKRANHPDGVAAGNLLSDLHSDRIRVDYRLSDATVETAGFAKLKVEIAVEIQRRLAAFRAACEADGDLRNRLRDGIDRIKAAYKI